MSNEINHFTDFSVSTQLIIKDVIQFVNEGNLRAGERVCAYFKRYVPWIYKVDYLWTKALNTKRKSQNLKVYNMKTEGNNILFGDCRVSDFNTLGEGYCCVDDRLVEMMNNIDEFLTTLDYKLKVTGGFFFHFRADGKFYRQHREGKACDFIITDHTNKNLTSLETFELLKEHCEKNQLKCLIKLKDVFIHLNLQGGFFGMIQEKPNWNKDALCCMENLRGVRGFYNTESEPKI